MKIKRKLTIITILVIIITILPLGKFQKNTKASTLMNIGDYVQFGSYLGKPILWQVINIEKDGSPMLWADRILCLKPFDSAESGYDGQTGLNIYTKNEDRQKYGSNKWENSNLREWLNSDEKTVKYTTEAPKKQAVDENNYASEVGFLSDFTEAEKKAIKPVNHKSILAEVDKAEKISGSAIQPYNFDIENCAIDNDKAYYKNIIDKVYLLDLKELNDYVFAGGFKYTKKPTQEAINNSEYKYDSLSTQNYWDMWLRTPMANSSDNVRHVYYNGYVDYFFANSGRGGVAPALNLKTSIIKSGLGTLAQPYIPDNDNVINTLDLYREVKTTDDLSKCWTIKFTKKLKEDTVNNKNIYVALDENGQNKIDVSVKLSNSGEEILLNYEKKALWQQEGMYYLFITKNVQSEEGKNLKNTLIMQFKVSNK